MKGKQKIEMKSSRAGWMSLWDAVATVLLFASAFFAIFSAVIQHCEGTSQTALAYGLAVLPGCLVIVIHKWLNKKDRKFLYIATALLTMILVALNATAIVGSITKLVNILVSIANENLHWGFGSLKAIPSTPFADFTLVAVIFCWVALLVSVFANGILNLLCCFVIYILLLIAFGIFPHPVVAVMLVLSTVAKSFSANNIHWKKLIAIMGVVVVMVVAVGGSFFYSGGRTVSLLRGGINDAVERMSYGEDTLPQGRLQRAGNMLSDDGVRLYVTLSEQTPTLYLKGFVGGELSGTIWQPTDKNAYVTDSSQGLIKYLSTQNFPFGQYAEYLAISGKSDRYFVEVENVGANSKYVYTPYSVCQAVGIANYDMNIHRGIVGSKAYSYEIVTADVTSEKTVQEDWLVSGINLTDQMRSYIKLDGEYRAFVYDTYLHLDDGQKETILQAVGGEQATSVFSISRLIRTWFLDNFDYSAKPDGVAKDFFEEFFGGKIHNANAAYFASAATLIFRAYGVPARYAEGYLVRADIAERTTLQVTGKNSHAWVEVYFDGIGWLPVEVTLKFFTEADLEENTNVSGNPSDGEVEPNVSPKPEQPEVNPNDRPTENPFEPPVGTKEHELFEVLTVLIPVFSAVLGVLLVAFAAAVRRVLVIRRKHKKLEVADERFGYAAMNILDYECKYIGGYSRKKAGDLGIGEEETNRFIELVERAVYGGYTLTLSERMYVEGYIEHVGEAICNRRGRLYRTYCKYVRCIGM